MDTSAAQLEGEGWLVNQQRLWLSSQWVVRAGGDLAAGGDVFFRHLLDGSRAANGLGWQWAAGCAVGKPYGFSRWQVEKRAPGLCRDCARRDDCPVQDFPRTGGQERVEPPAALRRIRTSPRPPVRAPRTGRPIPGSSG
jgi:deoxyribodipyrimidine photo-lyase